MEPAAEIRYASATRLFADALDAFLPAELLSVAQYAAEKRWLANEGGGYVGRWRHEEAPYLVGPMEALTSLEYLTVAVAGPGQSGKTAIAENWLLHSVGTNPGDLLWYMQTDQGIEAYVKGRINPMVDAHDVLRSNQGLRPVDDSLHFKRFRGMKVEFLSATASNLINKSAPRIVADEVDAYPEGLGDVKALLDVRRQTFGRESMILALSHPDRARGIVPERDWTAGIMAIYGDSDRRVWYWPCPHCGAWSSPAPIAARVMTLDYPADGTLDEIERAARLICPVNGCLIEDHERRGMNLAAFASPFGGWIGDGQEIDEGGTVRGELVKRRTAGFWIVGVMSPFILGGIGSLARAHAKAARELEASGEDKTLREVTVKQIGVPYTPPRAVGSIDANTLADRAEPGLHLGQVPAGVRFLTLTVDCQIAHFDWLVLGWGLRGETWVVDRGRLPGDPATSPDDWDRLLAEVALKRYPLSDGSGRGMAIRGMGYDSGGAPGVTQQAYAAWSRWKARRAVRLFGKIAGRDVWSIVPMKGTATLMAPRLKVAYPDTARKANAAFAAGTVPVAMFNANAFKDDLAGQLQRAEPGDWYVHFPAALRSKEPPHVWFEQLCAEQRQKNGRWEKIQASARNEALDLFVMGKAIAHLHGLTRINWERPPLWAAAWDENSMIRAPEPVDAAPGEDAAAPSPATSARPVVVAVQPAAPARRTLASRLA